MKRKVRAWAVASGDSKVRAYGNGSQFQYPIFPTRREAREWINEREWLQGAQVIEVAFVHYEDILENWS